MLQVEFKQGKPLEDQDNPSPVNENKLLLNFCLIHFASYSAARKTLETLREPHLYQVTWISIETSPLPILVLLDEYLWEISRKS